jgi:hypothetical protein
MTIPETPALTQSQGNAAAASHDPTQSVKHAAGILFVLLICSLPGWSQSEIEVGVRGGIPFTNAFQSQLSPTSTSTYTSDRFRYTVGPTIRTVLAEHFAVQVDALYTHSRWDRLTAPGYYGDVLTTSAHFDRWDFPVLASVESSGRTRAFIGGGVAFRYTTGTLRHTHYAPDGTVSTVSIPTRGTTGGSDGKPLSIVVNTGLRWRVSRISLEPELRYSRVRSDLVNPSGRRVPYEIIRTPNQFEFLLGVTLPIH